MLGRQSWHVSQNDLESESRRAKLDLSGMETAGARAQQSRFVEPVLEHLGAREIDSLDFSDYEQATIVHDINEPVPADLKARFSCVLDGGTFEHVFNFPQAMRNAMEMVSVGGHFLGVGPGNNFPGHGFFQFSPELYWRIFSEENGFEVEEVTVCETRRNSHCYRIEDPATNGRRVEFTNSRPLYVMVRARRLGLAEIFKTTPQQPYYAAAWSTHSGNGTRPGALGLRGWAQRSLPESVKRIARPFAPRIRPLRFSGLKKL
jgi:hypothetical protein